MRMHEFITEGILNEWGGARSHPGYGRGIFRAAHYGKFAQEVSRVSDPAVKEFLTDWFADIFGQDNPKFKADVFKKAALSDGYHSRSATPKLQSRHFYYLAGEIKKIPDEHARKYVADAIGDVCEESNPEFKRERWEMFCGLTPMRREKRQFTPYMQAHRDANPSKAELKRREKAARLAPSDNDVDL